MQIKIDNKYCQAKEGEFILDVAKRNNIEIPSLCHNDGLPGLASCRLCIVEIIDRGRSKVVTSCIYPIRKEIEVITDSEKIVKMRKNIIGLLLSRAGENKYINDLALKYNVEHKIKDSKSINDDCILCGLCVKACAELGISAISTVNRGITKKVSTPYDEPSKECIGCSSCAQICPTDAIKVKENKNSRVIWNREFELLQCSICGKPFITREEFNYINKKLGLENDTVICEGCKRKVSADELKNVFSMI